MHLKAEFNNMANTMLPQSVSQDPHVTRLIDAYADLLQEYKSDLQQEISYDVKSLLFNLYTEYNIPPSTMIFCDVSANINMTPDYLISTESKALFKPIMNIDLSNIQFKASIEGNILTFSIQKADIINSITFFTNLNNMEAIFGMKYFIKAEIERFDLYKEDIKIEACNDFSLFEYLHNNDIGHMFKFNIGHINENNFKIHI